MICSGPGCTNELPERTWQTGRGRPVEYCSDRCRQRAHRARRDEDLALQVAELVRSVDDTRLFEAVLACGRPATLALRNALLRAERRVS